MSRNSSGTYTLPTGNPVVAGTTIDATWANTTLSDIATEITNSLARTGAGGMTAALRLANGTSTVPGLAWGDETGTGFYRAGTSDTRFVTQTALIQQWTATGTAVTGTFSVTGNTTLGDAAGDTLTITGTAVTTPNGLNIDSDTLVVDAANDRVGIGTTNPTRKLQVSSAGTNYIASVNTGANPSCLLLGADPGGTALYSWTTVGGSTGVPLSFFTGASESMRLDTSGNLGLGVTPSAWAGFSVFQNSRGSVAGNTGELDFSHNAYFDGAWKYIANGFATNHYQTNGTYVWRTAPSGTAGNAISFTQALTLTAAANLLLGSANDPGGANAIYIANTASVPGTPTSGGVLYVESGALKYKGSSGTVTTLAVA